MALDFSTTSKEARLNGVKVLVYSPAGYGKTTLCATAPSPLILSAESGLLSLRQYDIPVLNIKTTDDLSDSYDWLVKNGEKQGIETICLDSVTEIAEVVLSNALRNVKDPRQAYGELIVQMNDTIKKFRDLKGFNVYMAAKQEYIKGEDGIQKYQPMIPGTKLPMQLPYLYDEVFALRIGKTDKGKEYRYLQTQPDLKYDAKDRSGALDNIEKPDLTHVFNKILEGVA